MSNPDMHYKFIENITNAILVPIIVVDSNAGLLFMNSSFSSLCNISVEDHQGDDIFTFLFPSDLNTDLNAEFFEFQNKKTRIKSLFRIPSFLVDKNQNLLAVNVYISELKQEGQIYYLLQLNELGTKNIEEQSHLEKETMFQSLSKASTEILDLPDLESIYKYICHHLQALFPDTVVLFVEINEEIMETRLIEIAGLQSKFISRVKQITGYDPIGTKFKLVPEINKRFKSGNLTEFEGGLAEFSMKQFPAFAAKTLQKLLGIKTIYTIGINKGNELLGAIHFFSRSRKKITEGKFIELFVKHAGSVIQNRMMQDLLLQSEKRFRSIFEEAPMGIALIDSLNGQIYEVNQKFADIAGWSMEEIINTDWMDITHPDDVQPDLENMIRLNAGEIQGFNMDKRYIRKDGSFVWVNMTVTPASTIDRTKPRHLAIIEDITEKKYHVEQIQRERILLRTLIDAIPDTIYVKDVEGRKLLANLADVALTGHKTEEEITGKTDLEIFSDEDGANGYSQDMKVIQSGNPLLNDENTFIDTTGKKQWIQTTKVPLKNEKGEITGLIGIGKDISERKLTEKKLAENYQYIKSLIESIPMGMDVVDCEGTILFQNDIFKNELGFDAIGKKCWNTYRDDHQQCKSCPLHRGIELGITKTYEVQGVLGGRIFEISHTGILFEGQLAMLEIFHDITPIRESEQKLKIYSKELKNSNAAKDKLFSIISHDLRNPFTSIQGLTSLLLENVNSFTPEELHEILKRLDAEGRTTFNLLENLLNWSRTQMKKIEALPHVFVLSSLIKVCINSVTELTMQKNIEVISVVPDNITAFADDIMVETILRNLLTNAIKFTNPGGTIIINAEVKEEYALVSVADNGIGISVEILKNLFKSSIFTSTRGTNNEKGTGLGLTVSKEFIEMNRGKIWAESEPGVGSTFYFTLPIHSKD